MSESANGGVSECRTITFYRSHMMYRSCGCFCLFQVFPGATDEMAFPGDEGPQGPAACPAPRAFPGL